MNPLVTVVIPTYNRPEFLRRAIESVLNQTYSNIEILVVDDNDPDTQARIETEEVMKGYINNNKITYYKHDKNKKGSAARNTGWRASNGKYITFLDDDDEIHPNKIQKQVECLEKLDDSWGACYTRYIVKMPNGGYQVSAEKRSGKLYIEALMRTLYMGSGSNVLLRKSVVDKIGGYDESFVRNQDIEFLVRVLEYVKIAFVDEILLTIHFEVRQYKRSLQEIDNYAKYYLETFSDRINALSYRDKKRVISVIALERSRVAVSHREYVTAIKILRENNVGFIYICKYLMYLLHRIVTHKSYGFSI